MPNEVKPRLSVIMFPFNIPKHIIALGQMLWIDFFPETMTNVIIAEPNKRNKSWKAKRFFIYYCGYIEFVALKSLTSIGLLLIRDILEAVVHEILPNKKHLDLMPTIWHELYP